MDRCRLSNPKPKASEAQRNGGFTSGKRSPKNMRRDFDTVTILLHWKLWKERNSRVFRSLQLCGEEVF
jgi:hypothetical protein